MTYYDDVQYIEPMRPDLVSLASEEHDRTSWLVNSVQPLADRARDVQWTSDSADVYRRRVAESEERLDLLRLAFRRAAAAINHYAIAQQWAQRLVADGLVARNALGELIVEFVPPTQHLLSFTDPVRFVAGPPDPWFSLHRVDSR